MTGTARPLSEECCSIVFYGINHNPVAAERYYRLLTEWFQAMGHRPDKMGVSGTEHNSKLGPFAQIDNKLQRLGFKEVNGFELYATAPNSKVWWLQFFLSAVYEGTRAGTYAYLNNSTRKPEREVRELPGLSDLSRCCALRFCGGAI